MVINRLTRLVQKKQAEIEIKFEFSKNVFNLNNDDHLIKARTQVFNKLDRLIQIKEKSIVNQQKLSSENFKLNDRLYNSDILNAALIEQNFELAFLLLNHTLKSNQNNKIISDQMAYRNIGVIEANLGNFDEALCYFDKSIQSSENILEYSRNSYIKGLCLIKRFKKVEEGLEVIDQALQKFNDNYVEGDTKYKHEKAWLINGKCLGRAILASKLEKLEKEQIILEIIKDEMEAYKLISHEPSFYLVYLRFNLLANIAFLLEILGNYTKAIEFWERAFAPILANDGQYRESEKALTYRLGVLNINLSEFEKAKVLLERALELARTEGHPFHLNVILYAIGYLRLLTGDTSDDLLTLLEEGKDLAFHLNDDRTTKLFEQAILCFNGLTDIKGLTPPKVKLISYVPYIDLSFVPEIDLNTELIS